jgi:hypothetical protein
MALWVQKNNFSVSCLFMLLSALGGLFMLPSLVVFSLVAHLVAARSLSWSSSSPAFSFAFPVSLTCTTLTSCCLDTADVFPAAKILQTTANTFMTQTPTQFTEIPFPASLSYSGGVYTVGPTVNSNWLYGVTGVPSLGVCTNSQFSPPLSSCLGSVPGGTFFSYTGVVPLTGVSIFPDVVEYSGAKVLMPCCTGGFGCALGTNVSNPGQLLDARIRVKINETSPSLPPFTTAGSLVPPVTLSPATSLLGDAVMQLPNPFTTGSTFRRSITYEVLDPVSGSWTDIDAFLTTRSTACMLGANFFKSYHSITTAIFEAVHYPEFVSVTSDFPSSPLAGGAGTCSNSSITFDPASPMFTGPIVFGDPASEHCQFSSCTAGTCTLQCQSAKNLSKKRDIEKRDAGTVSGTLSFSAPSGATE